MIAARARTMLGQLIRRILPHRVRVLMRRRLAGLLSGDTSQAGEVAELDRLIRDGFPRVLVDVGAHDGVTISNSRPYTLRGWRAILVEPHPGLFAKLRAANRGMDNTTCVNVACSDSAGILPLYLGADGPDSAQSTLCTDDNPWFQSHRAAESVDVTVTTLTDLLAANQWPGDFSMLLVDAEGMDFEVLKGLDFDRFRPRIVVTEEYLPNPEKHRSKYRLLLDRGYTFYKMVGANTIWIANEWVEATALAPSASRASGG